MKTALGRGLDALIPETGSEIINLQITKVIPNKRQPRKTFNDDALKELAISIQEKGVIQPVIVTKMNDGSYTLIAGERRWRAATLAGLKKIPAIVKKVDDRDSLEIALIENIQREDLNPIEMAKAFEHLLYTYEMTQEDLSDRIGKDRATIANYMRLLKLPDDVRRLVSEERLSMGHAKAILAVQPVKKQSELARIAVKKGLSVREVEELARVKEKDKPKKKFARIAPDPHVKDIEDRLRKNLGTRVKIDHKNKKGKIIIEYYSLDELNRLLEILL